jgi:hypothetical protein
MYRDAATQQLRDEVDYYNCSRYEAIADYCSEFNCDIEDLVVIEF